MLGQTLNKASDELATYCVEYKTSLESPSWDPVTR